MFKPKNGQLTFTNRLHLWLQFKLKQIFVSSCLRLSQHSKQNKSLIHFCLKANFKAERFKDRVKDSQHWGQSVEFLGQKGMGPSSQFKELFPL
jgi:hypothetical protein